jgi:hypothetical protein
MDQVVASFIGTILPTRPDEQAVLGGVPGDLRDETGTIATVEP